MECQVKGLRVNYEVKGQGETVLLLHGWASSLQPYGALMEQLSAKYRVIAVDFPGMGNSEEPKEPWDVDGFADFVLAFLEQFAIKKLSLVGHSYGGRVIIKLANRQLPFAIDKIVLIDSAGIKPPASKKKNARHVEILDDSLLLEGITNKALRRAIKNYADAQQDHRS